MVPPSIYYPPLVSIYGKKAGIAELAKAALTKSG